VNVPEYMGKGGSTYRILTDHLGSVRLVVDASTGAVAQRIDYDAWGIPTFTGPADFQPFGFAGGLYDPDTGLVRFGARDYDARTGRWTSKDPIGFFARDTNLLAYSASDPINFSDVEGLWVPQLVGAVLGGGYGAITAYYSGASGSQVLASAAVGAFAGFLSTLPIPGANPILAGAAVGGFSAFGGNLLTQLAGGVCPENLDFESAAVSGLAGVLGGGLGGAAFGATSSPGFSAFASGATTAYFDGTARLGPRNPFSVLK
jgi:RHS repeat-associated protein